MEEYINSYISYIKWYIGLYLYTKFINITLNKSVCILDINQLILFNLVFILNISVFVLKLLYIPNIST